jgi:thiamine biosynthesis lipoprotein
MRPAMGTLVHVSASGPGPAVQQAVDAAFAAVDRIDRLMSFHDPQSELSRVNREADRTPQTVHPWTWAVLRRALRIAEASAGLFDITVAPLLVREGLLPGAADASRRCGNWRHIVLMPERRVFLERPMLVDLGGIAKGFAVDLAIHALRKGGCTQGVVNAGGDLRRFGPSPQPIHLRRRDGLVQVAELRCGAVATSVPHAIHADRLAQPIGSIFDPRTQQPWSGSGAVMVAAPSCVIADALTKVAALAGPACEPVLARFGARALWDADPVSLATAQFGAGGSSIEMENLTTPLNLATTASAVSVSP